MEPAEVSHVVTDMEVSQLASAFDACRTAIEAEEARIKSEKKVARAEIEEARSRFVQEQSEALAKVKDERGQLEREKSAFEEEKERVRDVNERLSSIVKLNVGGSFFDTSRTTLTSQKDSMLDAMFSGRHNVDKDDTGRYFLDRDGRTFEYVLAYLRSPHTFTLEGLSAREVVSLRAECEYFQLPLFQLLSSKLDLDLLPSTSATISRAGNPETVSVSTISGPASHAAIVGRANLPAGAVWKVTMQVVTHWVYAGIISNHQPICLSYTDPSSCGWASASQCIVGGTNSSGKDGWIGWQTGDEAIFKLDIDSQKSPAQLRMWHKRTNRIYALDLPTSQTSWRLHLNLHTHPSVVVVGPPSQDEVKLIT